MKQWEALSTTTGSINWYNRFGESLAFSYVKFKRRQTRIQKVTYFMVTFLLNIQDGQFHTNKSRLVSRCLGRGQ